MNLTTFLSILRARWIAVVLTLAVTVTTTLVVSLLLPPKYKTSATVIVDSKSKDPVTGMLFPGQLMAGYVATQVDIISSHTSALKVVDALGMVKSPAIQENFNESTGGKGNIRDWLADLLLKELEVTPSRESSVINIAFSGADPKFVTVVANAFANSYINTNLELRTEPARQVTEWYQGQLKQLRGNLDEAQKKLTEYQQSRGLIASDERMDVETARLQELSNQYVSAQSMRFDASSRQNQSREGADVVNSGVVQQLRTDLARKEAELAQMAENMGQNHPVIQRLKAEVDSMKSKLDSEMNTAARTVMKTANAAQQREDSLRSALAAQKAKLLELKKQREELNVLAREVENAQRIYDAAAQRASQSQMEAQATQTEIAILNTAVEPTEPDSPNIMLNMALSVFLGGLLSVGLAFVLELLDRRVRTPDDISGALGIPVLSVMSKPRRRFAFMRRAAA